MLLFILHNFHTIQEFSSADYCNPGNNFTGFLDFSYLKSILKYGINFARRLPFLNKIIFY